MKNQIFILYKLFSNQISRSQVSGSQKHPQIADLHVLSPFRGQVAKSYQKLKNTPFDKFDNISDTIYW